MPVDLSRVPACRAALNLEKNGCVMEGVKNDLHFTPPMFNSEFTPEKMVVARRSFPIGFGELFRGELLNFGGGGVISWELSTGKIEENLMWNLNEFDIIKSLNCREAVGLLSSSYCILKRAQGTTGLLGFTKLQEIYHLGKKSMVF